MHNARTYTGELESSHEATPADIRDRDWALVERVQSGDVQAFDQLVHKYRERLYGVIYNLTSNREDASDLTQETLIKAFQNIHRFRRKASFFTWIYRIGINHTLSHLRKNRFRRFFSFESVQEDLAPREVLDKLSQSREGSDRAALLKELQEHLNEALQKLKPKHRTVVVLHEIDQLSLVEVARILKVPEATVRSRLHYARKLLQKDLSPWLHTKT